MSLYCRAPGPISGSRGGGRTPIEKCDILARLGYQVRLEPQHAIVMLMAPVALAIADDLQASSYAFAMIVALAASTAFMTPISSPVNMLVVAPGNCTFGDFVRVGAPFAVIVMVVSVILVPWLLPLY
jgi:TRAP-type mannitol/chloroaromatic compound transport system permease large subunit